MTNAAHRPHDVERAKVIEENADPLSAAETTRMRCGLAVVAVAAGLLTAGPARADFTKSQELTILAARSAILASEHCPYALDERRMQQVLARKGLSRADVMSGRGSALLQDDLAADARRYETDTAAACDQAWASFGPGAPLAGLLRRK